MAPHQRNQQRTGTLAFKVAQRILGSASGADDALQEAWLRLGRETVARHALAYASRANVAAIELVDGEPPIVVKRNARLDLILLIVLRNTAPSPIPTG